MSAIGKPVFASGLYLTLKQLADDILIAYLDSYHPILFTWLFNHNAHWQETINVFFRVHFPVDFIYKVIEIDIEGPELESMLFLLYNLIWKPDVSLVEGLVNRVFVVSHYEELVGRVDEQNGND